MARSPKPDFKLECVLLLKLLKKEKKKKEGRKERNEERGIETMEYSLLK